MAVICRTYEVEDDARRAVDALMGAGVAGEDIRVLMGEAERDTRTERQGDYASEPPGGDVAAGFAGQRSDGAGVSGAYAGMADTQRGGSFADTDRDTVTSYPSGVERRHVASHHDLRALLLDAGLDEATADRDVASLHEGRTLVLADVGDRSEADLAGV